MRSRRSRHGQQSKKADSIHAFDLLGRSRRKRRDQRDGRSLALAWPILMARIRFEFKRAQVQQIAIRLISPCPRGLPGSEKELRPRYMLRQSARSA
jgi:hypothetical protein